MHGGLPLCGNLTAALVRSATPPRLIKALRLIGLLAPILLGLIVPIRILLGRSADLSEHPRVAPLRFPLAAPDHLHDESPIIAVVEQEQHRMPDRRERLGHTGALHT